MIVVADAVPSAEVEGGSGHHLHLDRPHLHHHYRHIYYQHCIGWNDAVVVVVVVVVVENLVRNCTGVGDAVDAPHVGNWAVVDDDGNCYCHGDDVDDIGGVGWTGVDIVVVVADESCCIVVGYYQYKRDYYYHPCHHHHHQDSHCNESADRNGAVAAAALGGIVGEHYCYCYYRSYEPSCSCCYWGGPQMDDVDTVVDCVVVAAGRGVG